MEHRLIKKLGNLFSRFESRAFRAGSFSTLAGLLVAALAILIVLGVNELPTTLTKLDTTKTKLFSLSEQSQNIARGVTEDVTIYLLAETGGEDPALWTLLERYAAINRKIRIERIDPALSTNFLSQYSAERLYTNSLVVVSGNRHHCVDYSDVYLTKTETYAQNGEAKNVFNGEGLVTAAIDRVTGGELPVVYHLTGHGESYLPSTLQSKIALENITLTDISLFNQASVPADAAAIIIYTPKSDLTREETTCLTDYLTRGGRLIVITDYMDERLENLLSIMEQYGLGLTKGLVIEGDSDHSIRGYSHFLLPTINSHPITTPLRIGGYPVLMPLAHGIELLEPNDATASMNIVSLFDTSVSAYAKPLGYNSTTLEREDADLAGPFSLGASVESPGTDHAETKLIWLSTSEMFKDEIDSYVSGANQEFFLNALNWLCEKNNSIGVHAKDIAEKQLLIPSKHSTRLGILFVAGLPLVLIVIGATVVLIRKRK